MFGSQIIQTQALIGNSEDLANLLTELTGDDIYVAKVKVRIQELWKDQSYLFLCVVFVLLRNINFVVSDSNMS